MERPEDAMSAEPTVRSPRAPSSEPGLARRESVDDNDYSVNRKRPRLDSGSRAVRSLSADRVLSSPMGKSQPDFVIDQHAKVQEDLPKTPRQHAVQPPHSASKITINLHLRNNRQVDESPSTTDGQQNGIRHDSVGLEQESLFNQTNDGNDDVVCLSPPSSTVSGGEVEIEAVEPEDINDDSGALTTVEIDGEEEPGLIERFWLQFPYLQDDNVLITAQNIIRHVETQYEVDGQLLTAFTQWFEMHDTLFENLGQHWYELYYDYSDVWDAVGKMFLKMFSRSVVFGADYEVTKVKSEVPQLLLSYVNLICRMLRVDCDVLDKSAGHVPLDRLPVVTRHLRALSLLLQEDNVFVRKCLVETFGIVGDRFRHSIADRFLSDAGGGLLQLTRFLTLCLTWLQDEPALATATTVAVLLTNALTLIDSSFASARSEQRLPGSDIRAMMDAVRAIGSKLEESLNKQNDPLSSDHRKEIVPATSSILNRIMVLDGGYAEQLFEEIVGPADEDLIPHYPLITELSWRIKLMKKYICNGRMELRVIGVDSMQQDLVNFFNNNRPEGQELRTNETPPPFQRLARVLLDEKIVDFLVGVGSHPQIIHRSANIIGFLVVTNNFTTDKADMIWQTLTTSQDPRVVSAVYYTLQIVTKNLTNHTEDLYLCKKFLDAPLQSYGPEAFAFVQVFLSKLREELQDFPKDADSSRTLLMFCIRLICTSGAVVPQTAHTKAIRLDAVQTLAIFSAAVPAEIRHGIYRSCIESVQKDTSDAPGFMQGVLTLLRGSNSDSIFLARDSSTIGALLDNFCNYVQAHRNEQKNESTLVMEGLGYRLDLILHLVGMAQEPSPLEAYLTFWNHLVGQEALNDDARDFAWRRLSTISQVSGIKHGFLDQFYDHYLPTVLPQFYTPGFFDFVQSIAKYKLQADLALNKTAIDLCEVSGLDLVWRVMLTAIDGTGEDIVMRFLAQAYLDKSLLQRLLRDSLDSAHVSIIHRCLKRMGEAFSYLRSHKTQPGDERDSMDAEMDQTESEERAFRRMIRFLGMMLSCIRKRPEFFSPASLLDSAASEVDEPEINGTPLRIPYQIAAPPRSPTSKRYIVVGDLETRKEFHRRISVVTGFSKFKTIWAGIYINLLEKPMETLRDIGADKKNMLFIKEDGSDPMVHHVTTVNQAKTLFEREILKQFDNFYKFMDSEDAISHATFDLLKQFAPHEKICVLVANEASDASDVFPTGQFYRILYSLRCFQSLLEDQRREKALTRDFVLHGIHSLESILTAVELPSVPEERQKYLSLVPKTLPILLDFLKEIPYSETSPFADVRRLITRILDILPFFIQSPASGQATCDCYDFILTSITFSEVAWDIFSCHGDLESMHHDLLVTHRNPSVRNTIAQLIKIKITRLPDHSCVKFDELVNLYWDIIAPLLLQAVNHPLFSEDLFQLALFLFDKRFSVNRLSLDDDDEEDYDILETCHRRWQESLVNYRQKEFVGREVVDPILAGFSAMLCNSFAVLNEANSNMSSMEHAEGLWSNFLFPDLPTPGDGSTTKSLRLPLLDNRSRSAVYRLLRTITFEVDENFFFEVLSWISDCLTSEQEHRVSLVDPTRILRGSAGYVGLRNLSNTCYMNSLLTQLFMNTKFRAFLLGCPVVTQSGQQKLLEETQTLFANMQNSYGKSADPWNLTRNIRTYTGGCINVAEQMDVEEFFNLLFEQWEEQMMSAQAKQTFRSFYGGKVVYQIKSKECVHVSEREEPCMNIQCDVQGKSNLFESLQAFVEGDFMQGDNRYKCEKCGGKLVDAVRRTCLKEIPDHVIFHLKRFEYDIGLQRRSKINDLFEFPMSIDLSPYTFDHLSNPDVPMNEDRFELVGILVHKGQAEHGHYISYIRSRPTSDFEKSSWYLFDDADVSEFDPNGIADMCYGGLTEAKDSQHNPMQPSMKAYNAYMLFYQRASSMKPPPGVVEEPPSVPRDLEAIIARDNAELLRNSCLFGSAHQDFIKEMCSELRDADHHSGEHSKQRAIINVVWTHIWKVSCRTKDLPDFEDLLDIFRSVVESCDECCYLILAWFARHCEETRDLLTRSTMPKVRQLMASFIFDSVNHMRENADLYGIDVESPELDPDHDYSQYIMPSLLESFRQIALNDLHHNAKSWDDFFGLLSNLASLGRHEVWLMIDRGFLTLCLEFLVMHQDDMLREKYIKILKMFERRSPSYNNLIELLHTMLRQVDLKKHCPPGQQRLANHNASTNTVPLSTVERRLIRMCDNDGLVWILRMFDKWDPSRSNVFVPGEIVTLLLRGEPELGCMDRLFITLRESIEQLSPAYAEPFIRAATYFCFACPHHSLSREMIQVMNSATGNLDGQNGLVFLTFYDHVRRIKDDTPKAAEGVGQPTFYTDLVKSVHVWGPNLLVYTEDQDVRIQTFGILQDILLRFPPMVNPEENPTTLDSIRTKAVRALFNGCFDRIKNFITADAAKSFLQPMVLTMKECASFISKLVELGEIADDMKDESDETLLESFDSVNVAFEAAPVVQDDELAQSALSEYSDASDDEPT